MLLYRSFNLFATLTTSLVFLYLTSTVDANGTASTTIAGGARGSADGLDTSAQFDSPGGIVFTHVDGLGTLYVSDQNNHVIRKVDIASGAVTTFVGTTGSPAFQDAATPADAAMFNSPYGLAYDETHRRLFVADRYNNRVRVVESDGTVWTLAGDGHQDYADGQAVAARFNYLVGLSFCSSCGPDGLLYIADGGNHCIRVCDIQSGNVTTFAGDGGSGFLDGPALLSHFFYPYGTVFDERSGLLYVADFANHAIRVVSSTGMVQTLAGGGSTGSSDAKGLSDGVGANAHFNYPVGIVIDPAWSDTDGTNVLLYVADALNHRIRYVSGKGVVKTLIGSSPGFQEGTGTSAQFSFPLGLALDPVARLLYVTDRGNQRIRSFPALSTGIDPNAD